MQSADHTFLLLCREFMIKHRSTLNTKMSPTPAFFLFLSKVIEHKIELDQSFYQQNFS